MNHQGRILAVIAAMILFGSSAVTIAAQDETGEDEQSSVETTADDAINYLAVTISKADFESVPYSFEDQNTSGSLTISITDTRGTAHGWSVNVSASPFTAPDGLSFDVGNLALKPTVPLAVTGSCGKITSAEGQNIVAIASIQATGQRIWSASAANGAGCFDLPVNADLLVPGETLIGTYTSTITVSVSGSAP